MGRPKQISDGELVRAARGAFLRHGPRIAVTEIAAQLGVSAAAVFQRVGSKAQLMRLALAPGAPPTLQALAREPESHRAVSVQLEEHLAELMAFFKALVPSLIVLRAAGLFPPPRRKKREGSGDASDPRAPSPIVLREHLGSWLATARTQGRIEVQDPRVCAEALLGAMEARCFNAHVGGDDYVSGSDSEFLAGLIAGLLKDLQPARKSVRRKRGRVRKADA